jgi:hypothetical protein
MEMGVCGGEPRVGTLIKTLQVLSTQCQILRLLIILNCMIKKNPDT